MRAFVVLVLLVAACGDNIAAPQPDAASSRDAAVDAQPDATVTDAQPDGAPDARAIGSLARLPDGGMVCVPISGGAPCEIGGV